MLYWGQRMAKTRILIVDDEASIRKFVRSSLQQEGYEPFEASDGEIRRDNYVYYYCQHLDGFDAERRARITGRSGSWSWVAPMITGPIATRSCCWRPIINSSATGLNAE